MPAVQSNYLHSTSKRQSDKGNISSGVTESGRFAFRFPAPPSIYPGPSIFHSNPFRVPLNQYQTSASYPLSRPKIPSPGPKNNKRQSCHSSHPFAKPGTGYATKTQAKKKQTLQIATPPKLPTPDAENWCRIAKKKVPGSRMLPHQHRMQSKGKHAAGCPLPSPSIVVKPLRSSRLG